MFICLLKNLNVYTNNELTLYNRYIDNDKHNEEIYIFEEEEEEKK